MPNNFNGAQMPTVIHRTLNIIYRSLLVARAAKTICCKLFSFAHSILLRFAAQSFVILFVLFHPINSYALQLGRTEDVVHIHKFSRVPSTINICVCDNSVITIANYFLPNIFLSEIYSSTNFTWRQRGWLFHNDLRSIYGRCIADKGCVSYTKTFSGSFPEVLNIHEHIGVKSLLRHSNPCPIFDNKVAVSKVNASFGEFQGFPCFDALKNTYNYISKECPECKYYGYALIGEFFLLVMSVCLNFAIFEVSG